MKKIIYIILFAVTSSLVFSSCTEEVVAPRADRTTSGPSGSDPL